jgi:hypothetical protein
MKVKFLKPHSAFGYFQGDIGEITAEWAAKLQPEGYIMVVPEMDGELGSATSTPSTPSTALGDRTGDADPNTLPKDMPGRDKLFEAGYGSVEAVKAIADLLDVGVSKAMAGKIKKYLKG